MKTENSVRKSSRHDAPTEKHSGQREKPSEPELVLDGTHAMATRATIGVPALDTRFATPAELAYANRYPPGSKGKGYRELASVHLDRYASPEIQAKVRAIAPALTALGFNVEEFLQAVNEGIDAYRVSLHLDNSAAAVRQRCIVLSDLVRKGDTLINGVQKLSLQGSAADNSLTDVAVSHDRASSRRKGMKTRRANAKKSSDPVATIAPQSDAPADAPSALVAQSLKR